MQIGAQGYILSEKYIDINTYKLTYIHRYNIHGMCMVHHSILFVPATSLVTYAGERYDFILEANNEIDNYWIRYRGLMDCDEV